jgi:hypothetical protein
MFADLWFCIQTSYKFRGYRQKIVTPLIVLEWLRQFDRSDRKLLRKLVRKLVYIKEKHLIELLLQAHRKLLDFLREAEFSREQVIFLSFDEAGSSSATVLNLLRDAAHLEAQNCEILDARDLSKLGTLTYKLGEGVLVYVDDFVGSGNQVSKNINFVRPNLQGNFVEVVLSVCVCEEAIEALTALDVRVESGMEHLKAGRPLYADSRVFTPSDKERLVALCKLVAPPVGLGFRRMATMVVLYRNTPNNCPTVFRGSKGQRPYFGILPRTTDLEVPPDLRF